MFKGKGNEAGVGQAELQTVDLTVLASPAENPRAMIACYRSPGLG